VPISLDRVASIACGIESRPKRQSNRVRAEPWYHRGSDVALASTRCGRRNRSRSRGIARAECSNRDQETGSPRPLWWSSS